MPLPDAPDPDNTILYEQLRSKTLSDLTIAQLDQFRSQFFVNGINEDDFRRLELIFNAANLTSSSGVIPGSTKIVSVTSTSDGSYVTLFQPNKGEIWVVNSAHMSKVGSGTTVHSISYYDGSTDSQWFYLSSGSTDTILTSDDNWPTHPMYLDHSTYFRYKGTNNFSSSTIQLVVSRVR